MKKLYVYADFDWLKEMELVGELGYESLRGSDSYSFSFHDEWLRKHGNMFLSEDLNSYPGMQYTQPGKDVFGCFSDALPDRWGRTLLLRREQITASEEGRPIRRLSSFDFLTGIDDFSRMGGFRFKEEKDGDFINVDESLKIPSLADVRELIAASMEIEKSEEENLLPARKWINQLVMPDCGSILPTCLHRRRESMPRILKSCPLGRNTIRCFPGVLTAHLKAAVYTSLPQ